MGNVRALLARLNPTNVRFDVGHGGGAPELTAQDIAAALAFVPAGLGREILLAAWWPDGAARTRDTLMGYVKHFVFTEYRNRERALSEARLDLAIAKACAGWHGPETIEQRREVRNAKARFERAVADRWPETLPGMLPVLTRALIMEIGCRSLCPRCEGRATVLRDKLWTRCPDCYGSGTAAVSDRTRALAIGRSHVTYRSNWANVYSWMWTLFRDEEATAAQQLAAALRRQE
jgi:hypothetical protein